MLITSVFVLYKVSVKGDKIKKIFKKRKTLQCFGMLRNHVLGKNGIYREVNEIDILILY